MSNNINIEPEKVVRDEDILDETAKEKKKKHHFRNGFLLGFGSATAVILIAAIVFTTVTHTGPNGLLSSKVEKKLSMLSNVIDSYYYKDVSDDTKATGLYKGLLSSMGDEYTEYYTAAEYKDLMVSLSGDYAGIGAVLSQNKDTMQITVNTVYSGSPAEKAGLKKGDIIISVDGNQAVDESLNDFVQRIRGEKGTSMTLVYERDGERKTVSISRDEVIVPSVSYKMLSNQIGYIQITQFSSGTQKEFEAALADLKEQGMKGIVFDLRDNPGGMVDSVVAILDDILPKGTVVYMKDKNGKRTDYTSDDEKQLDLPMTVLVNENSASAAEIFTGAVMDFQKGTVIGTKTFGKGIVQTTLPFSDGSAVKITTASYYTPNGTSIQGKGIQPNVQLEYQFLGSSDQEYDWTLDNQIQKAIEVLKTSKYK